MDGFLDFVNLRLARLRPAALWYLLHLCRDRILEVCRILSRQENRHFELKSFRDRTLPWQ